MSVRKDWLRLVKIGIEMRGWGFEVGRMEWLVKRALGKIEEMGLVAEELGMDVSDEGQRVLVFFLSCWVGREEKSE